MAVPPPIPLTCPPELPSGFEDYFEVETETACAGLAALVAQGYVPEVTTESQCAGRIEEFEEDERFVVEEVVGGDCFECLCCPCPCCTPIGFWSQLTFSVAGVTGPLEEPCDDWNGPFTAHYVNDCTWEANNNFAIYHIECFDEGVWFLISNSGAGYTSADFDCRTGGTFIRDGDGAVCTGFPASIVVSTAGTWISCGEDEPGSMFAARTAAPPAARPVASGPPKTMQPMPGHGPGTELKKLLGELGRAACGGCGDRAGLMDRWGVEGCEKRRVVILARLRKEQAKRGWLDKLRAAGRAVASGLVFKLDPFDPSPGLFDEAIRRATAARPS